MARYRRPRDHENDVSDDDIISRDTFLNLVGIMIATVFIIMMLINVKGISENTDTDFRRGNMYVELTWPDDVDLDIDLRGKSPDDRIPVSFQRVNGKTLSLVRDDLGYISDNSGRNYEVMVSRGLPEGEWIFTAHWYGDRSGVIEKYPDGIPLRISIRITKDDVSKDRGSAALVHVGTVIIKHRHEEVTLVRFIVTDKGNVLRNSVNQIPFKLVNYRG